MPTCGASVRGLGWCWRLAPRSLPSTSSSAETRESPRPSLSSVVKGEKAFRRPGHVNSSGEQAPSLDAFDGKSRANRWHCEDWFSERGASIRLCQRDALAWRTDPHYMNCLLAECT